MTQPSNTPEAARAACIDRMEVAADTLAGTLFAYERGDAVDLGAARASATEITERAADLDRLGWPLPEGGRA